MRALIDQLHCEVRLTAQQNVLLVGIEPDNRTDVNRLLHAYGVVEAAGLPPVLRHSMACPALPTCGQAVTESERIWPGVAARIQQVWEEASLSGEPLCVRMTGCPNGCARPYTAEVGIVGQSAGLYSLYVGGSPLGTRLAELFRHELRLEELVKVLHAIFERYARERRWEERLGDWASRTGVAGLLQEELVGCCNVERTISYTR